MFEEATPYERQLYYSEEWKREDLPDFIVKNLKKREFGFDHDGTGPKDRYNQFFTGQQLTGYLKESAPYAAYSSIAFYKNPASREGWEGAELVFDIDAKDLIVRSCGCTQGDVCERCLGDAKDYVLELVDTLKGDFGLKDIKFIYSGRGYHVRILDSRVLDMESTERGYFLDYVTGGVVPEKEHLELKYGYPRVFRERLLFVLKLIKRNQLEALPKMNTKRAEEVFKKRRILGTEEIPKGDFSSLQKIIGKINYLHFLEGIREINAQILDGKVTVDTKRILRLPGSLHSKVSMKCMEIKNLEKFDPFRHAVPKFVTERNF